MQKTLSFLVQAIAIGRIQVGTVLCSIMLQSGNTVNLWETPSITDRFSRRRFDTMPPCRKTIDAMRTAIC